MKRYFIFLFLVMLYSSCKLGDRITNKPAINEYDLAEFKISFFEDCLAQSLGRDVTSQMSQEDISTSSDLGLGINNYRRIRLLSDSIALEIKNDSIKIINQFCKNCDEETFSNMKEMGSIGKRTFKFCLDYYVSSELDSIARQTLRKNDK